MTGEQSRRLRVGDRVCWNKIATDLGTIVEVTWSGVAIKWDDGGTVSMPHNDMAKVEFALANLNWVLRIDSPLPRGSVADALF
jgi:hypothetical protein